MTDLRALAQRYVAVWNEPDAQARRAGIEQLWVADGGYFNDETEFRGYDQVEQAVERAHKEFVGAGFEFALQDNVDGHHNTVRFNWHMVPAGGGPTAAVGFDFMQLDDDGHIVNDYQYIDQQPAQ